MNSDAPATTDTLQRRNFAKSIAKGICVTAKEVHDGYVVGITGKWGSGKSTLLSFIKEYLEKECKEQKMSYQSVEFNPWMFSEAESIKKAFLKHFLHELQPTQAKASQTRSKFARILKGANDAEIIPLPGGDFRKKLVNALSDYIEGDNAMSYKSKIDDLLKEIEHKVFVFIDDIDRLYPKQVFEILQVLKLTANFKNTFYIVAFDREAVEASIETQFETYGSKYLDKIIQADFVIPEVPPETIERLFFEMLRSLLQKCNVTDDLKELEKVWLNRGLRHFFQTLRDVYRFINSLSLTLPHVAEYINIADFVVLECLRLHDYPAYTGIYRAAMLSTITYEQNNSVTDSMLSENVHSNQLIRWLFIPDADVVRVNRLRDPQCLGHYFTLRPASGDFIADQLKTFFATPFKSNLLFNAFRFDTLDSMLLRLCDTELMSTMKMWDFDIIRETYNFFSEKALDVEQHAEKFSAAIINLSSLQKEKRDSFFNQLLDLVMGSTSSLNFGKIYFLHFMTMSAKRPEFIPFAGLSKEFTTFFTYKIDAIIKGYKEYLKNWQGHFVSSITHPESRYTFYLIRDYATHFEDQYRSGVTEILSRDSSLVFYLINLVVCDAATGLPAGIESGIKNIILPGSYFKEFTDRLEKIDTTILTQKQIGYREFILTTCK